MGMCGGSAPDPNPVTALEREQARAAVKNYNEYLKDKPTINAYLADISRDPAETARSIQGQAGADLAQKSRFVPGNPNAGVNINGDANSAQLRAKVMNSLSQDAISQQAAAKRSFVENAMGIQSTVNTAQQGMAADAVSRSIAEQRAEQESRANTASGIAAVGGSAAAIANNYYKQPPE